MRADYFLENESIRIGVNVHGAELVSLYQKEQDREYMWSGDENFWGRISPVLFPFVGKLKDGKYRHAGIEFSGIPQHGFARDCDFQMVEKLGDVIWFELYPDDKWKANYPFQFLLRIGYRIEGRRVHVMWTVRNDSGETMYFSIGGHPAFVCPDGKNKENALEGYRLNLYTTEQKLVCGELNADGTMKRELREFDLNQGKLELSQNLFAKDALIIKSDKIHKVAIIDPDGEEFINLQFDTPQLGIWSPAGKNAPFVCVEPWFGRCDMEDFSGELFERAYGNVLEAGHSFNKEYVIEV